MNCCSFLFTQHLLHFCPSWKRDPSTVALPEASSIVFFFYSFKRFFFHQHVKFFLTRIEGLRTEDVVHCTDCKAHWGNVIVILGYINKIDLIWFDLTVSLTSILIDFYRLVTTKLTSGFESNVLAIHLALTRKFGSLSLNKCIPLNFESHRL